jgi:hypothetical protein
LINSCSKLRLLALVTLLLVPAVALAQDPRASLASLPDADVLIYVNPQKILNDAAPRLMPATEITKMRAGFADMKKGMGVDPSSVEYLVIALRFHKPAGDLSFVAPDIMAVAGGDFSADALVSMAQLMLQEKVRLEKHGSKTIALMTIDEIAAQAIKNPMLKSLSEVGAVALSPNSIAIGNLPYLKSAVEAADGTGRISAATLESLLRDPNALAAASGAPLTSFAKAFGLFGTETTPRDSRCDTPFGNFYTALTIVGTNFNVRGAMNADNPDTAQIISNLLAGLMQQGIGAVPDKKAQSILQTIKMTPQENEIVWAADIPQQVIADFFKPSPTVGVKSTSSPAPKRAPVRRKRNR